MKALPTEKRLVEGNPLLNDCMDKAEKRRKELSDLNVKRKALEDLMEKVIGEEN